MNKRPIIIDCDPGIDDVIAIEMALACDALDVRAITIVGGNQTLAKCVHNALSLLDHLGISVPVAAGAEGPMLRALTVAPDSHGESGLGSVKLAPPTSKISDLNAVEMMDKVIRESAEPVTIVALGPLTNVAAFLLSSPDLIPKIECISLMGGAAFLGNSTPTSEFNIWEDPEAADIVWKSGVPIIQHGLDVTYKAGLTDADIETIRAIGTKAAVLAADLLDWFSVHHRLVGRLETPMHDSCAVAHLIDPSLFTTQRLAVEIDCDGELTLGSTVTDLRVNTRFEQREPNTTVALDIDRARFVALLCDSLRRLP